MVVHMSRDNATWLANLQGDAVARNTAVRDLREILCRNLQRALSQWPDEAFVEDAVQDALVRILDRLDRFEGRSRFVTWATTVTIRVALSELRRRRWKDVSLDDVLVGNSTATERVIDRGATPEVFVERQALIDALRQVVDNELTDRQRYAIAAELRGMPQDEIARHLGSTRNAVYKLTHDARKKLKLELEAQGYSAADIHQAVANS